MAALQMQIRNPSQYLMFWSVLMSGFTGSHCAGPWFLSLSSFSLPLSHLSALIKVQLSCNALFLSDHSFLLQGMHVEIQTAKTKRNNENHWDSRTPLSLEGCSHSLVIQETLRRVNMPFLMAQRPQSPEAVQLLLTKENKALWTKYSKMLHSFDAF